MNFRKTFYSLLAIGLLWFTFMNSASAQCNCNASNTHYIFSGTTDLTSSTIPSTGNNYCIEILSNAILRIDDSWNANNVCIKVSLNGGKIIIENGQLANLTNATVESFGGLIEPFTVEAGATLQVGHSVIDDVRVGFRVQGSLHLDDVDISGTIAAGVAVVGPNSEDVYIDNSTIHNLTFGITLLGVSNNVTVSNSNFYSLDQHGVAATGVSGVVSVGGNDFANLTKGMHFGSSSASHLIYGNTTTNNVHTGMYANTLETMYLNGNSFTFTGKGADLRYIEALSASGNVFSSTQTNSTSISRIGLDVTHSNGSIAENVFEDMDVGAFFREYNRFDDAFTSNHFVGDQTHGLYLADGARIGPQCYQHNLWLGNYSQDGAYSPDFSVKYNSKFTVNKYVTGEWPSHSPSGWFVHQPFDCPEDEEPGLPGPGLVGNDSGNTIIGAESAKQVNVFPNPATDFLDMVLPTFAEKATIELRDLTGRIVQNTSAEEGVVTLHFDLSNVHPGIYTLTIQSGDFWQTEKIIVTE